MKEYIRSLEHNMDRKEDAEVQLVEAQQHLRYIGSQVEADLHEIRKHLAEGGYAPSELDGLTVSFSSYQLDIEWAGTDEPVLTIHDKSTRNLVDLEGFEEALQRAKDAF